MKIYFVRHGETEYNKKNIIQGEKDVPLNSEGQLQAERLSLRFQDLLHRGEAFSALYTSPLSRARETAEAISGNLHLPLFQEAGLREISMGDFEGQSISWIMRKYKDPQGVPVLSRWKKDPLNTSIPGAESIQDADRRVVSSINKIISAHRPEDNIIIVTHGGAIALALCHVLKESLAKITEIKISNASITAVEVERDLNHAKILYQNDTSHLLHKR